MSTGEWASYLAEDSGAGLAELTPGVMTALSGRTRPG
jgi:hypothetical protein